MTVSRLRTLLLVAFTAALVNNAHAQTSPTSVQLTWTAPGDDANTGTASQYDLRYSTSPINEGNFSSATRWMSTPTPASAGTQQSTTVGGLTPSTLYYFALKTADDASNWSAISNVVSRTTPQAPDITRPAPIAVSVSGVGDTTVTITWTAVGDDSLSGTASNYDIRYSTSPITNNNWSGANQVANEPSPQSAGTSQSHTIANLSRQTTYYFAMRAADEANNTSALSNVANTTTLDTKAPNAVNNLSANLFLMSLPSYAILPREQESVRK
jgi:phosphodiesterase/alkaline phosphatase D-like protein